MGWLLNVVVSETLNVGEPAKAMEAGAQSIAASESAFKKFWTAVSPYVPWLLLLLGLALAGFVGWRLFKWWKARRAAAPAAHGPPPMAANRLVQVRRTFLNGLPLAHRAAVVDLPTVVVFGPAGNGKTRLIGLDVDWQRQARQYLPSYTSDALLQMYLGPDCVVHEVSAPLLEDETLAARTALRRMWSKCFSHRQQGLAVITLDVRWLSDTPPDEQRRFAQLLRGKLNLMSEACRGPVETRLCLTNMDGLEGFEDFARLLKSHGVALAFDVPRQGEEGSLSSLLQGQEQYLALGLTSLPVEAFERLERFYSQGGRSFSNLGRFVTALLEGDTLSFKPLLSRVYLSSLTPEARAGGTLSVFTEENTNESMRKLYLRTHLRRAASIAAIFCLPVLAAYANFYLRLGEAQDEVALLEAKVDELSKQGLSGRGEIVEVHVNKAAEALLRLKRSERWWPPLETSFPNETLELRQRLASGIRGSHLKPALERCRRRPQDCRPEQVVYLLSTLHASHQENDGLGDFVTSNLKRGSRSSGDKASSDALSGSSHRTWISALDLSEPLIATYIVASDQPWERSPPCRRDEAVVMSDEDELWSCWPYTERLTFESQLKPWLDHLRFLRRSFEAGSKGIAEFDLHRDERERLQAQLADLDVYASLPVLLNLFDASPVQVNTRYFPGIETTVDVLDWLRRNREALTAILRMEDDAYSGLLAVRKMGPSELLTRDGLWLPGANKGPYRIELLQETFEFVPTTLSRDLLQKELDAQEASGQLTVNAQAAVRPGEMVRSRVAFETDLKPLVDDFTLRIKSAQLPTEEAARRSQYVQKRVNSFSQGYRDGLFHTVDQYRFTASRKLLIDELARLSQPSSSQVDMLRDVADRASLEPLEGPYYEPLRNAVAPFRPVVQLMVADKSGFYAALAPYQALVAQMRDELDSGSKAQGAAKDAAGAAKADPAAEGTASNSQLSEMISPLEKIALAMLLEEEGSYLRKAQAWLDSQGLTGELRKPFLAPFLAVQRLGKEELESTLSRQWEDASARMLRSLLSRYPFNPDSKEDVDPSELEVLRRKDGAFWHFVEQVYSRVCVERGSQWALHATLREKLVLPASLLPTLSQLSRLARLLWDEEGRPRPLILKVQPQPLPPPPMPGVFVTMSSLKCGKTTAYGFNQSPSWQDFPLNWWDQQVSSIVLELRSPSRDDPKFLSLPWNRSIWSCFRLFEEALVTSDQRRQWSLVLQGNNVNKRGVDISFGLKGDPWMPFREVPR
ncbi:MAG: hypothetical protein ABW123_07520 [Cystobacter sp.]